MQARLIRYIDGERGQEAFAELKERDVQKGERHCREQFRPMLFTPFDLGVQLHVKEGDNWVEFWEVEKALNDKLQIEPGDRVYLMADDMLVFECPACGHGHNVTVNGRKNKLNAGWTWNGDKKNPTLSPSVRCLGGRHGKTTTCHLFVREGKIQYCADCPHDYAGQTVELPEVS